MDCGPHTDSNGILASILIADCIIVRPSQFRGVAYNQNNRVDTVIQMLVFMQLIHLYDFWRIDHKVYNRATAPRTAAPRTPQPAVSMLA